MKAVILAAGKGTRMGDLSLDTPKPMLKVMGKTLLQHKLEMMPDDIDEVIIVVGHLKEQIQAMGEQYGRLRLVYIEQKEMNGTAGALWTCRDLLSNEKQFLVMSGDDIFCKKDAEKMIRNPWAILIREMSSVQGKGKIVLNESGGIDNIIDKYPIDERGFVDAAMYCIGGEIFHYPMVKIHTGEYGLPQTILSAKDKHKINSIKSEFWLQITKPEDLKIAENKLNR